MDDLLEPHEALILDSAIGLFAISGGVMAFLYASSTLWSMYQITLTMIPYGVFYVGRGIRNYIHNIEGTLS